MLKYANRDYTLSHLENDCDVFRRKLLVITCTTCVRFLLLRSKGTPVDWRTKDVYSMYPCSVLNDVMAVLGMRQSLESLITESYIEMSSWFLITLLERHRGFSFRFSDKINIQHGLMRVEHCCLANASHLLQSRFVQMYRSHTNLTYIKCCSQLYF